MSRRVTSRQAERGVRKGAGLASFEFEVGAARAGALALVL